MVMKDPGLPRLFVVTADQRHSRRGPDRVPEALAAVASLPPGDVLLPFERTAGDEVQGLLGTAAGVTAVVGRLVRLGDWRIGVGVGAVEWPLPGSTRAARGTAYLAARSAVEEARGRAPAIALRDGDLPVGGPDVHGRERSGAAWRAESALMLWGALLARRTPEGWEVADLLDAGLSTTAAARALGISASAASQRAGRAAYAEVLRGAGLVSALLEDAAEEVVR